MSPSRPVLLLLVALLGLALCQSHFRQIKYKNCKSKFEILSVEATECGETETRCPFARGSEPRIRIAFKPKERVEKLETSVRAKLGSVFVPFHLENNNACTAGNLTCPLEEGKTYYYSQSVKILNEYPKVNVQVNWLLTDPEDGRRRDACIIFLAEVV
uniref:ML domain-containing protein n=1 Tax=Steinernema glaseri TaxID=37863 RepID=A0A1I7ZUS3_9BILA